MKLKLFGTIGLCATLLMVVSATTLAREAPVAKLVEVEGIVEHSRDGTNWKPVRRTKYLFAGYKIRTGNDGEGDLVNQNSGMIQTLGPNSQVEIGEDKVILISGSLSEPKAQSEGIFSIIEGLANKFAKAQRYTTVRRSVNKEEGCDAKVRTIKKLTLSAQHPDLVWRNACPEYSYRLVIDDQVYPVPAQSTAEMIRFPVTEAQPGIHKYRVEVLDVDGVVYIPKSDSVFEFLGGPASKEIESMAMQTGDDVFLLTSLLESKGMHVAAMDAYRDYFNENPDDNDMRPLLIQIYNDLSLMNLKDSEARLYNASLEDNF